MDTPPLLNSWVDLSNSSEEDSRPPSSVPPPAPPPPPPTRDLPPAAPHCTGAAQVSTSSECSAPPAAAVPQQQPSTSKAPESVRRKVSHKLVKCEDDSPPRVGSGNNDDYLRRLLQEAQRESNTSSTIASLSSSTVDSPSTTPRSPPNSPVRERNGNRPSQRPTPNPYYINQIDDGLSMPPFRRAKIDDTDWMWDWSSRPQLRPPKNWAFRQRQVADAPMGGNVEVADNPEVPGDGVPNEAEIVDDAEMIDVAEIVNNADIVNEAEIVNEGEVAVEAEVADEAEGADEAEVAEEAEIDNGAEIADEAVEAEVDDEAKAALDARFEAAKVFEQEGGVNYCRGASLRRVKVGRCALFSRDILYTLVLSNVLSLILGTGIGMWLSRKSGNTVTTIATLPFI